MNEQSHKFIWFELAALLTLLALAMLWVATPRSMAQQDNRQLKREQTQPDGAVQRRVALVIGNGAYKTVPALNNPSNDATLLAATLRKLGFEVTVATDKSQREMKRLIREFGVKLRGGGGVGLFYFAGHGVQARGHNFLIPVDADIQTEADLEDVAVDVNYVLNMMDDAQNALNIAILDACRNNPFARSFRSALEGLAQVKAPTGTLIAYATAPDNVAADGGGANSPYAEELTRQIQTPGVLLETMFRRVAEQVSMRSGGRQEPWYSANVKGDFYFSIGPTNSSSSNTGGAVQPAKIDSVAVEREYWETIRNSNDAVDYKDYLQAYPSGAYTAIARAKVKQLEVAKNTTPNTHPTTTSGNTASGSPGAATSNTSRPKSFKSQHGIEMVYIPPGSFDMGSNNGGANEKPVHRVTIGEGFYIGKFEVTQSQWQDVMGNNPSSSKDCGGDCPVEGVTWDAAVSFIARLNSQNDGLNYRLPTEAEWEYAARAGTTGDYAGDLDAMAWYGNNSGRQRLNAAEIWRADNNKYPELLFRNGGQSHPVGRRLANAFGLYDMYGNVWEWCQDRYHDNYIGGPLDGSGWMKGGEEKYRVLRGGSWGSDATLLRSASRYGAAADGSGRDDASQQVKINGEIEWMKAFPRYSGIGFRVVAVARTQ